MAKFWSRLPYRIGGPVLLLLIWLVVAWPTASGSYLLPSPQDTFSRFGALLGTGDFYTDILLTVRRWLVGYLFGVLAGVPVGLLMGSSSRIYLLLEFLIEFFRSLPVTALFPLFLLAFGIGDASKIAMVFTSVVFVVILNTAYGVFHSSKLRLKMAKTFGASPMQIFVHIRFFDALPSILVGMRTSLSLSLIVVVVSEMFIGTEYGLGQRIFDAYTRNDVIELYAVILFLGLTGYGSNRLFIAAERRLAFWAGK